MLPKVNKTNYYNRLFSESLEKKGVQVNAFKKDSIFKIKKNDIIHFHWPSYLYQHDNILLFLLKSFIFISALYFYSIRGVKIVWTIHNIYPHKIKYRRLEKKVRNLIAKKVDLIFVCAKSIKNEVVKEFDVNEGKVKVVYHGHYLDAYKRSNVDFRKHYQIPEGNFIFLFFGSINEYKGIPELIKSFNRIKDKNVTLLIVGKPNEDMKYLLEKYKDNENIIFDFRFVPDDEVADLISIADFIVLPYREITTSGTAILALSFKKPVISPRTPFMKEFFDSKTGILYDNCDTDGLYNAMLTAISKKTQISDKAFEENLRKLDWDLISDEAIKYYKEIILK